MSAASPRPMHVSTRAIPERDRLTFCDEFAQSFMRLELHPTTDAPVDMDLRLHPLAGLNLVRSGISAHSASTLDRTDWAHLVVNRTGQLHISQGKEDAELGAGDAYLVNLADPLSYKRTSGDTIIVGIQQSDISRIAPNFEDVTGRVIPKSNPALSFLNGYINIIGVFDNPPDDPVLEYVIGNHVRDLLGFLLKPGRDTSAAARSAAHAARIRFIKRDIVLRLRRHDLSVSEIASIHKLSPRHLHRLFESEGLTVSGFILEQRLQHIHKELESSTLSGTTISDLAFSNGFGDPSYFNRVFRQRFGYTPGEIRHASRKKH
jgi:AraC-like DNA-binding protein